MTFNVMACLPATIFLNTRGYVRIT